jgi:hypothetical protein
VAGLEFVDDDELHHNCSDYEQVARLDQHKHHHALHFADHEQVAGLDQHKHHHTLHFPDHEPLARLDHFYDYALYHDLYHALYQPLARLDFFCPSSVPVPVV